MYTGSGNETIDHCCVVYNQLPIPPPVRRCHILKQRKKVQCIQSHQYYQLYIYTSSLVDPGFYVPNWLFIGKCHMQLGHKEEAKEWLKKAADYPSELPEIVEVH